MKKLLIANRGEIALRIIRACRELNIETVAIYSDVDRTALHVRAADEAYLVGPAPARESYINIPKIVEVAKRSGCDAIHPGYGFLAENAEFAEICIAAGLIFVGPSPEAIRLMGDKVQARQVAIDAGLPIIPGTMEELRSLEEAQAVADQMGYPVLLKASGGGGGRGIRLIHRADELPSAFQSATSEALAAFGNGGVYLERYLSPIRHVEVQIIADRFGKIVALGERDCSIQRRHQKLIEEAPSTAVSPELRARMQDAAIRAAAAVAYEGLGTVEFLLDSEQNFYFMEMNTRLQVEHPITEMITGVDLVVDQLRLADGQPLEYSQEDIELRGWAIECRITSEDPFNEFLPDIGVIRLIRQPGGPGIRLDTGLYDRMEMTVYYDPMIAKLIAYGATREQAIRRMTRALCEFQIVGVRTNIPFHLHVLESREFQAGRLDTGFAERQLSHLRQLDGENTPIAVMAAALLAHQKLLSAHKSAASNTTARQTRTLNPWTATFRPGAGGRNSLRTEGRP